MHLQKDENILPAKRCFVLSRKDGKRFRWIGLACAEIFQMKVMHLHDWQQVISSLSSRLWHVNWTRQHLLCSCYLFYKFYHLTEFWHSPILPPLAYGARRSTTLMPVSRISCSTLISLNSGASWWIEEWLKDEKITMLEYVSLIPCSPIKHALYH